MKKSGLLIFALGLTVGLFAQNNGISTNVNPVAVGGAELGAVIAVVTSWSKNESIRWAILHGLLGWIYVIHFAITRNQQ